MAMSELHTKSPSSALLHQPSNPSAQHSTSDRGKPSRSCPLHWEFEWIRRATAAQLSITAVILSTLIPFAALITWIAKRQEGGSSFSTIFDTFAGEKIGGRLTQPQAKAIDVVAGAILAPLVAAGFNFVLFNSARVSVASEKSRKSIPLRSLIAASSTSSDFRNLIQSRSWKLCLLASITLLAALSKTAFTNVVAYEAYQVEDVTSKSRLRLQTGREAPVMEAREFTQTQEQMFTSQLSAMLISLPSQNTSAELTHSTYIAGNVTQESLDKLSRSVVWLENVPAYRLSIDCRTDVPNKIFIIHDTDGTDISLTWEEVGEQGQAINYPLTATFAGTPADMGEKQGASTVVFAAFNSNATEVYLGALTRYNLTNETGPSTSYGNVKYRAFNMTQSMMQDEFTFRGSFYIMSAFGIRCSILREEGLLNYTRIASNGSGSTWGMSEFEASRDSQKTSISSLLYSHQGFNLNFHMPGSMNPGIASAFLSKSQYLGFDSNFSLDEFALKFLYGSGEAQRLVYEVAATNLSESNNPPEFFVEVPSIATAEHYRITLVPSLLLVGLFSLLIAGLITTAMMAYTWKTQSTQAFRLVDEARLLVDSAINLREETHVEELLQLAGCSNEDIDAWAVGYKVRYAKMNDGEMTTIVLKKDHAFS